MRVSDRGSLLQARGGGKERIAPLELFFDLVFVFALTQMTGSLAQRVSAIDVSATALDRAAADAATAQQGLVSPT